MGISFCLLSYFELNSHFTFILRVSFNNLIAFSEETLFFARFKARNKTFLLYLKKVSLIKHILYKSIKMECRELFYEKALCLHVLKRTCYFYFGTL